MRQPILVDVLADSIPPPVWVSETIRRIECGGAKLLRVGHAPRGARPTVREWLLRAFDRLDRLFLTTERERATACDKESPSVPVDTDRCRHPDLVLDLSSAPQPPKCEVEVWRIVVDGQPAPRPEAYFWSLYRGRRVCSVAVEAIQPKGSRERLETAHASIDPVSIARTRDPILSRAPELVARCVAQRIRSAPPRSVRDGDARRSAFEEAEAPHPLQLLAWSARVIARVARRRLRKAVGSDDWYLAVRSATPLPERADAVPRTLDAGEPFRRIEQPRGVFRADPFVLEREGRCYLFFEEYLRIEAKGHIAVAELGVDGLLTEPVACLVRDYHLSYPFVFEHQGTVFMLPESSQRKRVDLYRATRFPYEWTLERTLLGDVAAIDPTLVWHEERWWLFLNEFDRGTSPDDQLFLYSAPSLFGSWTPHPQNPIVRDVRCARPAGRLLTVGSDLVRPAQDGSGAYGSRIVFQRIDVLSESAYRESPLGTISSTWLEGALATHTYGRAAGLEVTDGRCFTLRALKMRSP